MAWTVERTVAEATLRWTGLEPPTSGRAPHGVAAQHEIATEMQVASPNEGVRILGAPYGGEDWCRDWLEEKNAEIKTHFDAIAELGRHDDTNSAQCAFLLLKFCAATKFAHLLRMAASETGR